MHEDNQILNLVISIEHRVKKLKLQLLNYTEQKQQTNTEAEELNLISGRDDQMSPVQIKTVPIHSVKVPYALPSTFDCSYFPLLLLKQLCQKKMTKLRVTKT